METTTKTPETKAPTQWWTKDGKFFKIDSIVDDTIYLTDQCGKSHHESTTRFYSTYSKFVATTYVRP